VNLACPSPFVVTFKAPNVRGDSSPFSPQTAAARYSMRYCVFRSPDTVLGICVRTWVETGAPSVILRSAKTAESEDEREKAVESALS
jgi:hypothetical protein